MPIVQTVNVEVRGDRNTWIDTGVLLRSDESVRVRATGKIAYRRKSYLPPRMWYAYPEGSYSTDQHEGPAVPGDVLGYSGNEESYPVTNTVPWSLALVIVPEGITPASTDGAIDDAFRPNRDTTYGPSALEGRIWLIFNDNDYGSNSGVFNVLLERSTDIIPEIDIGEPSPVHYVPEAILEVLQSEEQYLSWILSVKPIRGPWEGYTDFADGFFCPEPPQTNYVDQKGNITPRMYYEPNIGTLSDIPDALRGVEGTDATVLAPKSGVEPNETQVIYFPRHKVIAGYYEGAYWELGRVIPDSDRRVRWLVQCGTIGNIQADDLTMTPELTGYEEMAAREVGDEYHVICQVGARPNEEFGTGRCWNEVMQDGPLRADWSAIAYVTKIGWDYLRLEYDADAISGEPVPAQFANRLVAGDVIFTPGAPGGANAGYRAFIKSGGQTIIGGNPVLRTVDVNLRLSLPYLPEIGDQVTLYAGCRRTKAACIEYNNLNNMRAQDLVSNSDLTRHYRV